MSKFIKKILNFQKRKNGNISILVLIMSMAIILLTTAMVGYIFHDIGFTELDKGQLRALHFAESGLSDMYYNIDQLSKSETPLPAGESPDSYTKLVGDPDPEGSFKVEYEIITPPEWPGKVYAITSTGVDSSSGAARTVRVETWYADAYEFITSAETSGAGEVIAGNTNITGPFFVSEILESKISGNASFKKGPLYVKGDINISENASIGEPEGVGYGPIILVMGGLFNGEPFDPLDPPKNVYVSDYHNIVIDIEFPTIDSSYINSVVENLKALEIHGNLFIGNGIIKEDGEEIEGGYEDSLNSLKFESGVLKIKGNIVVYGNIEIGEKKDTIEYSGNANLISTEDITIEAKVRPEDMNNFPSIDLMVLISQYNIDIYANKGTYENPDVAAMLIANYKVETKTNTFLRGSTVSRSLVLGQNTKIHYETGIGEALTAGIPEFGENIKFQTDWQEIIAD